MAVGSIPIARSINPVDAVEFTGFLPPKIPYQNRFGRSWTRIPPISDRTLLEGEATGHTGAFEMTSQ
jgi:hypothetical protein